MWSWFPHFCFDCVFDNNLKYQINKPDKKFVIKVIFCQIWTLCKSNNLLFGLFKSYLSPFRLPWRFLWSFESSLKKMLLYHYHVTSADQRNVTNGMWPTQCDPQNVTHTIWPTKFDPCNVITTMWPTKCDPQNWTKVMWHTHHVTKVMSFTIWLKQFDPGNLTYWMWPTLLWHILWPTSRDPFLVTRYLLPTSCDPLFVTR